MAPSNRFELPQLKLVSYSLTDGTDIPPPPDSPIQAKPSPLTTTPFELSEGPTLTLNGQSTPTENGDAQHDRGPISPCENMPLSPASSKGTSSLRKFLSQRPLRTHTTKDVSETESLGPPRPDSAMSFGSGITCPSKKRNSSWLGRFGNWNSNGKRKSSVVIEEKVPIAIQIKMGPPPPKLPELNHFEAKIPEDDVGLGGEDLFKDIK